MIEERSYRKNLTTKALVYLGGQEQECLVKNLSITGLLLEVRTSEAIKSVKDIFKRVRESTVIDIYLPDLRLAGEAEVVWSDQIEDRIELALEFRSLSYNVDNLLYARKAYRKQLSVYGRILFNNERYDFATENVSLDGMMIRLPGQVEVKTGTVTRFKFDELNLSGEVKVAWLQLDQESTLMGLEYQHMEKDFITGIPRFFD